MAVSTRRGFCAALALAPWYAPTLAQAAADPETRKMLLSRFDVEPDYIAPGMRWRGFSDRVMGGVSDAQLTRAVVDGKPCIRLAGRVTTDSGGGFIQMALDLGGERGSLDASGYAGIELLVHGNNESYNVHLRTPDCRWFDHSYRLSFDAPPEWRRLRFPWSRFAPNGIDAPLDTARLERVAVLGWMRKFDADIALAEISLYA